MLILETEDSTRMNSNEESASAIENTNWNEGQQAMAYNDVNENINFHWKPAKNNNKIEGCIYLS